MNVLPAMVLGFGLLATLPSHADNGEVWLGAGLGGAVGAVVGSQIGGHDGAIVGGALGAATGAAIAYDDYGRPVRYVERYPVYGYRGPVNYIDVDEGHGHHRHHHRHHHRRHHHHDRHDRGYYDGYRDSRTIVIMR
ncbi:MAG: glycine zipper 2TM domain-containing protein [Halothiobacillaceae bacterium]|jgi:hypothetical protein|nr:MAG: glycine zipper 2TM domain-containing protein [Halothiobacillaceae bacterium]